MKRRAPCQMSRRNHSALAHFHRTSAARMGIAGLAVFSATDIDVLAPLLRLSNCQQFAQDRWRLGAIVALACPRHRSSSFQPAREAPAAHRYAAPQSQSLLVARLRFHSRPSRSGGDLPAPVPDLPQTAAHWCQPHLDPPRPYLRREFHLLALQVQVSAEIGTASSQGMLPGYNDKRLRTVSRP